MIAEQEVLYGTKSSPSKSQNVKKAPRTPTGGATNKRFFHGGSMLQSTKPDSKSTLSRSSSTKKTDKGPQNDEFNNLDDGTSSLSSGSFYELPSIFIQV